MKKSFYLFRFFIALVIVAALIFFWVSLRQGGFETGRPESSRPALIDHKSGGLIRVTAPLAGSVVLSPVEVRGSASGSWFFEGSFPVEVHDSNGAVIGRGIATSSLDWMTTGFIPFRAIIDFDVPPTGGSSGSIVLKRDNPSGEASNDQSVELPVKFN